MYRLAYELVKKLTILKKTIATMESCSGGALVNQITNVPGASEVIKYSAVTYSNEFKIKMGVCKDIIDKYSVYSKETAIEMSKVIVKFTNSDYGVGITGKINRVDKYNLSGKDNVVFFAIYDKEKDKVYSEEVTLLNKSRKENKEYIIKQVFKKLLSII